MQNEEVVFINFYARLLIIITKNIFEGFYLERTLMAAIRHIIQKEVFDPIDESIQGLVNVTKTRKKKKFSFLCLSGN